MRPYHERWVWDGQPLDGKDLLVRCYHGLGDTIQFARYLPLLKNRGRNLTVEIQRCLIDLLQPLHPGIEFRPFDPAHPHAPLGCELEIMEAAHALRATLLSESVPYLSVPRGQEVKGRHKAPTIGLCWSSGDWDPERSIPYDLLEGMLAGFDIRLVSLQRDALPDFVQTAATVAALDKIITVDTMIAHLAGALGRPTCLLLKAEPDWRWAGRGRTSVWYPSMRLYRQTVPGDWREPLDELQQDLRGTL
jgi:hypothetical protein